jgi:hypothetical protein
MKSRWEQYKEKNGSTPLDLLNPTTKPSTAEVANQRYSVCQSCERFIKTTNQCRECGCFMSIKVKIDKSKCPLNKW